MKYLKLVDFLNERTNWTIEMLQDEADKYKTKTELRKNNNGAFLKAKRLGILDELFKNHQNQGNIYMKWSKEKLQQYANKYKTRGDFYLNDQTAYDSAVNKRLIDELFKNHPNQGFTDKQKVFGYWTKEKLQEEADKYKNRKDFKNNKSAYSAASKKKLMDKLFKNHPNQGYSDKEQWIENSYMIYAYEIPKFNTVYVGLTNDVDDRHKRHLKDNRTKLYQFCKNKNISYPNYDILEENLTSKEVRKQEEYWLNYYKNKGWDTLNVAKTGSLGGSTIKWTKPKLQEEVKKYKTRTEFQKNSKGAYLRSIKRGLLDELFKNHPNQGFTDKQVKSGYWSEEQLQKEVDKYSNRNEFCINSSSACGAAYRKGILDELFKNHPNQGRIIKPSGYWTKDKLQKEVDKYKTREELYDKNKAVYSFARKKGLFDELFQNHPNKGYISKPSNYWTEERLKEESKKYKTRKDFNVNSNSAYQISRRKGILDELFKNHPNQGFTDKQVKGGYWTEERLKEEAKKYKNKKDFRINNNSAYHTSYKKGILDKFFSRNKG